MLQDLKRTSMKSVLPAVIIMAVIGVVMLAAFGSDFIKYVIGPTPFEELSMNELEGEYVIVNINMDFGSFAEETTTTTRNGATVSRRTSALYYVIPVGGVDRYLNSYDAFEFVGIKIPPKYFDAMKTIDNNSDDFFDRYDPSTLRTTLQVTGTIKPLDSEMQRYYDRFFDYADYSAEEIAAYCAPYYIDVEQMSFAPEFVVIIAIIAAVVLVLLAIYKLVSVLTGGYQKAMIKAIQKNGDMELDRADSDYQNAVELAKYIKGGRHYLFNAVPAKTQAFKLSNIVWAYPAQTEHRKNGRYTGTTYEVILYTTDDRKKKNSIAVPSSDISHKILSHIQANSPGTIIGYSDQKRQIYNSNYEQFLNLGRQQAEQNGQPTI